MRATIVFKTIGTHSPEAYSLGETESSAPPSAMLCFDFHLISSCYSFSIQHNKIDRGGGWGGERETALSS